MRIVIDMQGAQASNAARGIGRYSLALAKEMTRQRGENEVILALNDSFPKTIESIRAEFSDLIPQEKILVWNSPTSETESSAYTHAIELSREAFLANLNPDIILNTSLFEGLGDDAITSIGLLARTVPTAVVLYDLIPLIHRGIYLKNPVVEKWYLKKLDQLRRADLLLSISTSSGKEAVDYLGFPPEKVSNISTACDEKFRPLQIDEATQAHLRRTYGLTRPFVMYTGGIDHRKNIEGLIRAYALLPKNVRTEHQLAIVCAIQPPDRKRLQRLAVQEGLASDELIITGFVSEEDLLALYNASKLFVFPSWHEGFGLPALEAMACGCAVIGANTSSVPEVIGHENALFDPLDDNAISSKILQVLTDDNFRLDLERHGLIQAKKFSWEDSARRAWQALDTFITARRLSDRVEDIYSTPRRPRLAYFSPLPPEKSGISDYSAELLPELSQHYEIDVIVSQNYVSDGWVQANCPVRDIAWFRANAHRFDRVMYHFGNSAFHSHMFDLLSEFPGVVVLHDFFLSGIVAQMDALVQRPHGWARALAHDHGWPALHTRYKNPDPAASYAYPCNLEVLQKSLGTIVHSNFSCQLAEKWYGVNAAEDWSVIPLLRVPVIKTDRRAARHELGIAEDSFVICSYGLLGPHKLNDRLLSAWLASPLANDPSCRLVFVGENHGGDYGTTLVRAIKGSAAANRIEITGWTDADVYQTWLSACDVGVQLRTLSLGETSAAVLDCMNHGLPTIVNANGSMASFPEASVYMLPDEFSDEDLVHALTIMYTDADRRNEFGRMARDLIKTQHQPRNCANQYAKSIEKFYRKASSGLFGLSNALSAVDPALQSEDMPRVATMLAKNFPPKPRRKQLLLDISELIQRDSKSGIQRVVRALMRELLVNPPNGWAVEPVYSTPDGLGYRYARRFTSRFLDCYDGWIDDEAVEAWPGDMFLGLDLQHHVVSAQKEHLAAWHRRGVKVFFVVYDLLPVLLPHVFPPIAKELHQRWLETLSLYDGVICISRAVADEFYDWLQVFGPKRERPFIVNWFHLGADVENSLPSTGLPENASLQLEAFAARPTFLMVGTLEPRKGHAQTLAAFDKLWALGIEVNLVIVGKQGWMVETLIENIRSHSNFGSSLFWLESISDEYLEKVYASSSCLIASSYGEGFGLPLVEATQHKLPIIAREIPVFREVAGGYAHFFPDSNDPAAIATSVREWLSLYRAGTHPQSNDVPWLNWKTSAQQLISAVMGSEKYKSWMPDGIQRYWGSDPRLHTQVGESFCKDICTTGKAGFLLFGPYTPFKSGIYYLTINGNAETTPEECWMDVTCDAGHNRVLYINLPKSNIEDQWIIETSFVLDHAVEDLEVRVWVTESAKITVKSLIIAPSINHSNNDITKLISADHVKAHIPGNDSKRH